MATSKWQEFKQRHLGGTTPRSSFSPSSQQLYNSYAREEESEWEKFKRKHNVGAQMPQGIVEHQKAQEQSYKMQAEQEKVHREARAQMLPELESKIGSGMTLTPTEELQYAKASIEALSDGERDVMAQIKKGQDQNFSDHAKYDMNGSLGFGQQLMNKYVLKTDTASGTGNATIKEAQDILRNEYGWDEDKIKNYTLMSERLSNAQGTEEFNKAFAISQDDSNKFGKAAANTAWNLFNAPIEGVSGVMSNLKARPEGFGRDTNTWMNLRQNSADAATEQVTQNAITDAKPVGQFLYQAGLSTAESAARAMVGSGFGDGKLRSAVTAGMSAAGVYNSSYQNARERGATDTQAQVFGISAGALEAAGDFSVMEHFWNMTKGTKVGKELVAQWLAQAGMEATEEAITDITTRIADYIVLGKDGKSEFILAKNAYMEQGMSEEEASKQANDDFWKQVGLDALGGAISGGIFGAGGFVAGSMNAAQNKQRADAVQGYYKDAEVDASSEYGAALKEDADKYANNPTQYMADMIDDSTEEGKKRKAEVQKLAQKEAQGQRLTASDRNYIEESLYVADLAVKQSEDAMSAREQYKKYANEMSAVPSEYRTARTSITEDEARADLGKAAANKDIELLGETYSKMKNAKSAELRNKADEIYAEYYGMAESKGIAREQLEAFKISPQEAYSAGLKGEGRGNVGALSMKAAEAYRAGQKAYIENRNATVVESKSNLQKANALTKDGKNLVLTGTFTSDGNMLTQDGEHIALSDVSMEDNAVQKVYRFADTLPSVAAKNAYMGNMKDGTTVATYNEAWSGMFRAGRSGRSFESVMDSGRYVAHANTLGEDTLRAMYEAGVAQTKHENVVEATNGLNKAFNIKKGSGVFEDARADKSDNVNTEALRVMANVIGVNIRMVDDNASLIKDGANAYFDAKNDTIVVGSHATAQVFHEVLGEFTKMYASKEYADFKKVAMETSAEILGESIHNAIMDNYAKAYGEAGESNTDAEMSDEMANDFIVAVLSTEKGRQMFAKKLAEMYSQKEANTIKDKIVNLYKSIIRSIKNIINRTNLMGYQKMLLEKNCNELEKTIDHLMKAFDSAIQNHAKIEDGDEVVMDESVMENDGALRFSLATFEESGRDMLVDYLKTTSGLSEADQKDIIEQLDKGYELANAMMKDKSLRSFSAWSNTKLAVGADGKLLLQTYKADGRPIRSVVVNNGEYPLNIDFTQVCKKRIALNDVLNKLISDEDLNLAVLTESDIAGINKLIKQHGFEIACGLCFVDSKRYRVGSWADSFVNGEIVKKTGKKKKLGWNDLVESMCPKGTKADYFNLASAHEMPIGQILAELPDEQIDFKVIDKIIKPYLKDDGTIGQRITPSGKKNNPTEVVRMAYLLKTDPTSRHKLDNNDIIASDGLDALRENHFKLYALVNAHGGTSKPKLSHGFTAYGNDVLESVKWGKANDFNADSAYAVGGVRVQSFSDYVANMFFDYMQMFADMSARELPSHAYTKEPSYVRSFGMTGQKINMSLIFKGAELNEEQQKKYEALFRKGGTPAIQRDPEFAELMKHAGLDADGNYLLEDESFPFDEAMAIKKDKRYENCGTIAVGLSDAHIEKLLADPQIDMVIPYHASGVSQLIKKERNLALYTDYTKVQNTRTLNGDKLKKNPFDWYDGLRSEANPDGYDAKDQAERYKKFCKENGYLPKFDKFQDNPNYYKLLIDFKSYDSEGNYLPQGAVKMRFPEELKTLVHEALVEQQVVETKRENELSNEQNTLYTEVKNFLREKGTLMDSADRKFSINVDSEGNELTTEQKEFFSKSKVVDENGALKVMYHGTEDVGFTKFDSKYSDDGRSLFFTDNLLVAKGYSGSYDEYIPDKKYTAAEMTDLLGDSYYFVEENNGLYELVHNRYGEFITEYSDNYEGMMQHIREEWTGEGGSGNYKVYLNITNPLVINADGNNWDELHAIHGKNVVLYRDIQVSMMMSGEVGIEYSVDGEDFYENLSEAEFVKKFGAELLEEIKTTEWDVTKDVYAVDLDKQSYVPSNTREYAEYAQKNGYDGVIINDVYDIALHASGSEKYEMSTVVIAFDSNQIKSVANKKPTENEDIRYSLEIDDFFDIFGGDDVEFANGASILEEGMEALKHQKVDSTKVRSVAHKIRKEFGSTYNFNTLVDNLEKVFAHMQTSDHVNYNDMMRVLQEVAAPVIDAATTLEGKEQYDAFVKALKGYSIRLTDVQKQEVISDFGTYGQFRRMMMPLNISDNGSTDLESVWSEIADASGGVLDADTVEGDMPTALYDALAALRPSPVNSYGGNKDDVAKDAAMRIVEEYLGTHGSVAKEAAKKMKEQRAEYENKLKETRTKNRQAAKNARRKRLADHEKKMIGKRASELMKWVSNPTEKKHVPRDMVEPVVEFLYALDFVEPEVKQNKDGKWYVRVFNHSVIGADGKRSMVFDTLEANTRDEALKMFYDAIGSGEGSKAQRTWTDRMRMIENIFNQVASGKPFDNREMDDFMETIDPALADEFTDMLKRNGGTAHINQLEYEDLHLINKALRGITHAINQGNKAFTNNATIEEMARSTIELAEGKKVSDKELEVGKSIKKLLNLDMLTPQTYFHTQGKGGGMVYDALRKGFNTEIMDVKKAQGFMQTLLKDVKDLKKWTGEAAEVFEIPTSAGTIRLTTAQIMSLYMTSKRKQAMEHMAGGFRPDDIKSKYARLFTKTMTQKDFHLTEADIKNITDKLTDKQKEVATRMQKFLAKDCAEWGNEASMKMYGYEKFVEENYFPIKTVPHTNMKKNENIATETLNGIERSGFTKQIKEGARNPILIRDIFDVFTEHVEGMAAYHGKAAAIKDANRWFNYRIINEDDGWQNWKTTQEAIETNSGVGGVNYYTKLMSDINGQTRSQYIGDSKLMSNYKAASVGFNLRVVMQQPTAYFRAMNVINPKYLFSVNPKKMIGAGARVKENSPIAWWKAQGHRENAVSKSMRATIIGDQTLGEKVKDFSMAAAGKADDITWGILYEAVVKEQRDVTKGMGLTEEQFRQRVNERFDEVVDKTQVVDSTLHRSQFMRSKDKFNVLQSAFMSEPTKTYNMMYESMRDGKKAAARALATYLVTAAATSAAASVADMIRYTEDGEEPDEVWWENFTKTYLENIMPWNLIPTIKDIAPYILSFITGESTYTSSNRMDMDAIYNMVNAFKELQKAASGESNKNFYGVAYSTAQAFSQLTGIPASNIVREVVAIHNFFLPDIKKTKTTNPYNLIYDEIKKKNGDVEGKVKYVMDNNGNIKDIESGITSRYKSDYYDAYQKNPEEAQKIADEAKVGLVAIGMTDVEADATIEGWQTKNKTYAEIDKAIESGEGIVEEIELLMEEKKEDDIVEHIYNEYSSTIEYNRKNSIQSDVEDNVNIALESINKKYSYDERKNFYKEKADKKAADEAFKEKRTTNNQKIFNSIDTGANLKEAQKSVQELLKSGVDAKTIKSDITKQYKEKLVSDYKAGKNIHKERERIIAMKVYIDEVSGFTGAKDYRKHEEKEIADWFKD